MNEERAVSGSEPVKSTGRSKASKNRKTITKQSKFIRSQYPTAQKPEIVDGDDDIVEDEYETDEEQTTVCDLDTRADRAESRNVGGENRLVGKKRALLTLTRPALHQKQKEKDKIASQTIASSSSSRGRILKPTKKVLDSEVTETIIGSALDLEPDEDVPVVTSRSGRKLKLRKNIVSLGAKSKKIATDTNAESTSKSSTRSVNVDPIAHARKDMEIGSADDIISKESVAKQTLSDTVTKGSVATAAHEISAGNEVQGQTATVYKPEVKFGKPEVKAASTRSRRQSQGSAHSDVSEQSGTASTGLESVLLEAINMREQLARERREQLARERREELARERREQIARDKRKRGSQSKDASSAVVIDDEETIDEGMSLIFSGR